jgi:hypothetical protein
MKKSLTRFFYILLAAILVFAINIVDKNINKINFIADIFPDGVPVGCEMPSKIEHRGSASWYSSNIESKNLNHFVRENAWNNQPVTEFEYNNWIKNVFDNSRSKRSNLVATYRKSINGGAIGYIFVFTESELKTYPNKDEFEERATLKIIFLIFRS